MTFEEVRAHLGFESQRQWSVLAIGRSSPCLLGLFSVVVLIALKLHPEQLPIAQAAWYEKEEATFSDVLAAARGHLLGLDRIEHVADNPDMFLIPKPLLDTLSQIALYPR